jgi:biopolymer transport protein ExbB/TolQ
MWQLLSQGGVVMYPLALCSLLTVAILVERCWHFRRAERDPEAVISQAAAAVLEVGGHRPHWEEEPAPSTRVVGAALAARGEPRVSVEERVRATLMAEGLRLSAHVSIVGTIGNLAPFVGLFGTVLGIIRAFRDIGQVGAAGPAVVATGISEALVATASGLFVAISAVIAYNLLITWQSRLLRRAEIVAAHVVNLVGEDSRGYLQPAE